MKRLLLFLLLSAIAAANAQTAYRMKKELDDAGRKELLGHGDSIFYFKPAVAYQASSHMLKPFSEIRKSNTTEEYLSEQLAALVKNPHNAVLYNNIAGYYQARGHDSLAADYFNKALKNLKPYPEAKDSASYYSFRSIIKLNLKQEWEPDMERALAINKSDSLAMAFYPMMLVMGGKEDKAHDILLESLKDSKNGMKETSYLFISVIDVYRAMKEYVVLRTDEERLEHSKRNIQDLINTDKYDVYIDVKRPDIVMLKNLIGVCNAILRFGPGLEPESKFVPSKNDLAYMQEREKYFKSAIKLKGVNLYAVYHALGTLHYVRKDLPNAVVYYEKALAAFPKEKESFEFNPYEVYDNLASVHYYNRQHDKAIATLNKKLTGTVLKDADRNATMLRVARLHFEKGEMAQAEAMAVKALAVQDDYNTNIFLGYLSYRRNYMLSAERYFTKTQSLIGSENDFCELLHCMAVLRLNDGQPDLANTLYEENKSQLRSITCEECENLLRKYSVANK